MSDITPAPPLAARVMPVIALVVLAIFAAALAASCFLGNDTLRTQMFTGALTLATGVAGYYFGSSAGSAKKDDTIAASSAALATSTPIAAPSLPSPAPVWAPGSGPMTRSMP